MKFRLYIFLFLVSFQIISNGQIFGQGFGKLTINEGLSQGFVSAIIQDKTGFMWFGTNDGLNRFDGYDFKIYYNNITDTNSLSNNIITRLANGKNGIIWVGTFYGLNEFNTRTEKFRHVYTELPSTKNRLVKTLIVDNDGLVWFSYMHDPNIFCLNPTNREITNYKVPQGDYYFDKNQETISPDCIYELSDNKIWIGTNKGTLFSFDKKNKSFKKYEIFSGKSVVTSVVELENDILAVSSDFEGFCFFSTKTGKKNEINKLYAPEIKNYLAGIYKMLLDNNGNLLIGTQGYGLFKYNLKSNYLSQTLFVEPNDRKIIPKGIRSLFLDKSGLLWCGTNGYGVFNIHDAVNNFTTINQNSRPIEKIYIIKDSKINSKFEVNQIINPINFQSVRAIYANEDFIWVGGYNGLDKIDKHSGLVTNITLDIVPYVFCPDPVSPEKYLWVGAESAEFPLFRLDIQSNKFEAIKFDAMFIYAIYPDSEHSLWIGTYKGLIKLNTKTMESVLYYNQPGDQKCIQPGAVRAITKDKDGKLWIGTESGGLSMFDEEKGVFIRYQYTADNINGLSCNTILYLGVDELNNLLIGTAGGGVNILDKNRKDFLHLTTENGLPNNVIYSILIDNENHFWLSTNAGLCKLNPRNFKIRTYVYADGIQGNEFNSGSYYKDKNGLLYFGGTNGLTFFNPSMIADNNFLPEVVITYIKKNNEYMKFNKSLHEAKELVFEHNDKVFTLGFSALSYYLSEKNQYAYRITEMSNEWTMLGTKHELTFNSLEEGDYTLQIKASNNDGVWGNKLLTLKIKVKPPFYETWWFLITCLVLVSGIIISSILYRSLRNKRIKAFLKKQVNERTAEINAQKIEIEKQKEILENINEELTNANISKDKFFGIIAHDLKSPFNSIIGFSSLLVEQYDNLTEENRRLYSKNIKDASEATYNLLINLLEWARMQSGKIEFRPQVLDFSTITNETLSLFHPVSLDKNITILSFVKFNTLVLADENMVKTVLRNLVSNAIKFTNSGGEVKIFAEQNESFIKVSILDNGVGLTNEELELLFRLDRAYKSRGTANETGTGLGLLICKDFIERNGGKITVVSTEGKGSEFSFTLPAADHYSGKTL